MLVPWPVPLGSKQADDARAYIGTLGCSDQLDTHVMDFITRLWPRRHEIVDGGSSSNMQAGELFKIDRGRIVAVEAMGATLPYGTRSGWGE